MKIITNIFRNISRLIPVLIIVTGCNDYDKITAGYEPNETPEKPIAPPDVDPAWQLELLANTGQYEQNVFLYKDEKMNNLFTRTLGWNGGSGAFSTVLPDGNTFWSFGDSFYGTVDEKERIRKDSNFPRNSFMVQTGHESDDNLIWLADYIQTTNPAAAGYYQARTHLRHPSATLPPEEIQKGEIDQDFIYWPGDATALSYGGKNILQLLWSGFECKDGQRQRIGTCLTEYSLDGVPGDDGYMKLISVDHNFRDNVYNYGLAMFEDEDGHTYIYGDSCSNIQVARSNTHDIKSTWEYYIRDVNGDFVWQTSFPSKMEIERSGIAKGCVQPNIIKKGDVYYLIAQQITNAQQLYIYRSDKPYGPFTDGKILCVLPYTLDKLGNQSYKSIYNVFIHPQLSRDGELVFSTNTDPFNFNDNFNIVGSADYYRPYFFRVFNWESVYEE